MMTRNFTERMSATKGSSLKKWMVALALVMCASYAFAQSSTVTGTGSIGTGGTINFSSIVTTSGAAIDVFDFTINNPSAGTASTLMTQIVVTQAANNNVSNWTQLIAGAELRQGAATAAGTINATNITFGSLPIAAGTDIGHVADNTAKLYTVKIWFLNPIDASLRATIEGSILEFRLDDENISLDGASDPFSNSSDNSPDVTVTVAATELRFVQQPSNVLINGTMSPAVTVEATDANGNRDEGSSTTVGVTSSGTMSGTPTAVLSSGFGTYSAIAHTAAAAGRQLTTTNIAGLADANSSLFDIEATASNTSDIVATSFDPPDNIDYASNQAADATFANSIKVAEFSIRDGGGAVDGDALATVLAGIVFNVTDAAGVLRRIALYDGTTELGDVNTGATATFSSLALVAPDGGSKTFDIRVTFDNTVTDNSNFQLTVATATPSGAGSTFAAGDAGGASSSTAGDDNKIEVIASRLDFVQEPTNVDVNIAMSPDPTVHAEDALDNRDLDFTDNVDLSSSGTLTGEPITVAATAGLATYTGLVHTVSQTGRTLSATSSVTGTTSANFDVLARSNLSDIIVDATFNPPDNIAYANFQEATDIQAGNGTSVYVARFIIRDGGGPNDSDGLGTILTALTLDLGPNWANIRRIELRDDGDGSAGGEQDVTSQLVNLSGFVAGDVTATDNNDKVIGVRVSFQANVTDNQQFQITINSATASVSGSGFAAPDAGGAASQVAGDDNRIEVTADRLAFTVQPSATNQNAVMSPSPQVSARDALGSVDRDVTSMIGVVSTGSLAGSPQNATFVNGVGTYTNIVHTAGGAGLTLNTNSGTLTNNPSNAFTITAVSNTSDVITSGSFANPIDIPYQNHQENTDIVISGTSIAVEEFIIRDGGGAADGDAFPTTLTDITFSVSNPGFINRAALYDGVTELAETTISGGNLVFTGFSAVAPDDGSKTLTLRVSYTTAVTDNLRNVFTVTSVTELPGGSDFAAANGGGAASSTTGAENQIEVTATKLQFVAQPPASTNLMATMTAVTVEAADANNRRDEDYVNTVDVTSDGTMTVSPQQATFVLGLGTYSTIVHSVTGIGLTLTAEGGPITDGVSNGFNIVASNTSDIIANAGFVYTSNIAYENFQESADIVISGTSIPVAEFIVRDGGGASDPDFAPTTLTGLTLAVTNSANIRMAALYDGATELDETTPSGGNLVFSGFSASAADNSSLTLTVRISYNAPVTDNLQNQFTVSAASTQAGTSSTIPTPAGATSSVTGDRNRVEVAATRFDFVQQPTSTVESLTMTPSPTVSANDALGSRDEDYTATVDVVSSGPLVGSPQQVAFAAGLGTYNSIVHSAPGTGFVLTATDGVGPLADGLSSPFNIVADDSDIIENVGFIYPQNIAYENFQEPADIVFGPTSIEVAQFDVRDGGAGPDGDPLPTTLTDLTLAVTNSGFIRRAALYDGLVELAETTPSGGNLIFTGFSFTAPDDGSRTLSLRVSFTTTVVDNQQFSFAVTSATAQSGNSVFAAANAGGASTSTASDNNRIEVFRSQLLFMQQPTNTYVNFGMAPAVTVESTDIFNNRDVDFVGAVSMNSNGVLTGAPVSVGFLAGVGTYAGLVHTAVAVARTLSTSNVFGMTNANSTTFNILPPDNNSDIITSGVFANTSDIAYETFQENLNITTGPSSMVFEQFIIRDGSGAVDADPLVTTLTALTFSVSNSGFIRRAALYDGITELAETTPSGGNVVFTGFSVSAADGGNRTLSLRVSFTAAVVDNQRPVFTVTSATFQPGFSGFAAANAGGAVSSTTGTENQIEVFRSALAFVQQPTNTFVNFGMSPAVTVEAVDVFSNRDVDFIGSANVVSSGTLTGSPVSAVFASGLGTYPGLVHTATGIGLTLSTTNALALSNAVSSAFTIIPPSNQSDIIVNAGFANPSDIAYETFQENTNITLGPSSIAVEEFTIRDGAGGADPDPLETRLTGLTLAITNSAFIRRAALYDGGAELAETIPSGGNLIFTGFSANATDGGSKTLTLRVSFTTAVTDNQRVVFTVTSASTNTGYSGFALPDAGGAQSSTAGSENQVEVFRTKVLFVQQPTTTFINTIMAPAVTVQATDVFDNRDLDFAGTINITSSGTLTGAPVPAVFALGLGTYSTLTHTASGVGLTLGTTNGLGLTNATSSAFTILPASTASDIVTNAAFPNPIDIPYITIQENTNITVSASSIEVERFDIRDGAGAGDADPLATTLTDITFSVTNSGFIRRAALYNGGVELAETTPSGGNLVFTGFSASAPDGGTLTLSLRVSYTTAVVDNARNIFTVTSATALSGYSSFAAGNAGGAASSSAGTENQIEAVATRLDFTSQQALVQGMDEPINFPAVYNAATPFIVVEARDANAVVDLDWNFAANVISTGTGLSNASQNFGNNPILGPGKLDLTDPATAIQYTSVGQTQLRVTSGALTSDAPSIPGNIIDVIHTEAQYAPNGLTPSDALPGGSVDQAIFGFTVTAAHIIAGPEPRLTGFTIGFGNPITGVLINARLYESLDNIFSVPASETDLTGSLTQVGEEYVVSFAPRPVGRSYFLVVDIDPTASNITLPITPQLVDEGYAFPATNGHLAVTAGSSEANVISPVSYNFAAIFPPLLASSYPAKGQLNIDPNQPTIDLVFTVPVGSMDGQIFLYNQATGVLVDSLTVTPSGQYPSTTDGTSANPLRFTIPPGTLAPNTAYYILIRQGNTTTLKGIRDAAGNLFAGISYPGTLYFRTSDLAPPAISLAPAPVPTATGITSTGGAIGATFDKQGTAYFLIIPTTSANPTAAQIRNPATYLDVKTGSGSIAINQTKSIAQFGSFAASPPLATNTTYEVWMIADGTISLNGVVSPILGTAPFGSAANSHVAGTPGPTFTFDTPSTFVPGLNTNAPNYQVCKDAIQQLNVPLIISESANNNLAAGSQEFYLVLPANFSFDLLSPGTISVTPTGGDITIPQISYLGSSVLKVEFNVAGTATRDQIEIAGLSVISSVNASGPITRIGGSGAITGLTNFGTLTTFDTAPITFDNSYSRIELGNTPANVVTTIPDNYDQVNPDLAPFFVELIPPLPSVINDFGSNEFSGPGVNVNTLSLKAVTLGAPFFITLTHTDENGCVSQNSEQYTVYDHNTAIGGLPTEVCAVNSTYETPPVPMSPQVETVVYNNLGAYYMDGFSARIPRQPTKAGGGQYPFAIDSAAWHRLLVEPDPMNPGSTAFIRRFGGVNPTDDQFAAKIYYDYDFDLVTLLNALPITTSGTYAALADLPDPYDYFLDTTDVQGHIYHNGGSLGIIEFNAIFQSIANSALRVPLRQNLNVYLPPVPIVEVNLPDTLDTTTPMGIYGGIPVFCEANGIINIDGYPKVTATSQGRFRLLNHSDGTVIWASGGPTPPGFQDNTNGTAFLNPAVFNNLYRDIRIEYTFQEDVAQATNCGGRGFTVIRISPTPIASFVLDQSAYATSNPDLIALGACEGAQVTFDGSSSNFGPLVTTIIPNYRVFWNFDDAANSTGANPNTAIGNIATHTFNVTAPYSVNMIVRSSERCTSAPLQRIVQVGKNPEVNSTSQLPFTFTGTSVATPFQFTATMEINSAVSLMDTTKRHVWTWGDGTPNTTVNSFFTAPVSHVYSTPGRYFGVNAATLLVTSRIGCVDTVSRPFVVLPQFDVDSLNVYREGFLTNANWQYWETGTAAVAPSWSHGNPTDLTAILDPNDGNLNVWTTNLNGPYNSFERSALYSPAFDLSALKRPLITFNSVVQMESGDGVVLQYSMDNLNVADPAKTWTVLGIVGGGVEWYNTSGLPSKPGDQVTGDLGWSSKAPLPVWKDSKYALADNLGNLILGTNVVFRFALASAKNIVATDGQGFALDNVRVGERTRTILLESFASTSNPSTDEKAENDSVAVFNAASVGLEVVKFNYHLNFPGNDPFNEQNPADPSSRALYYGVTRTPHSVLDGYNGGPLWHIWGPNYFNTRSLQLAEADMEIRTVGDSITADGKVSVYVDVTPRVLGGLSPNTILQVGVMEEYVPVGSLSNTWQAAIAGVNGSKETRFEFVVKKLIPSAAGTRTSTHPNAVGGILQNGITYTFGPFEYTPLDGTFFAPSTNDLSVAAFLQNELSREIYQSEIKGNLGEPDISTITGLEPVPAERVLVYPNPANLELTVRLPSALAKPANLQLIDQTGRSVLQSSMPEGSDRKTLNVSDLSGGMYILTIDMGQGTLTRKKVMIVHQD